MGIERHEWRDIKGFPNYKVSNYGKVKSFNIKTMARSKGKLLALNNVKGYRSVTLCNGRIKKLCGVHRLVLLAFKGECPEGYQGSHIDGNSSNNRIDNLVWESVIDNNARKKEHKTLLCGESIYGSKLKNADIPIIKSMYVPYKFSYRKIAEIFNVSPSAINRVILNKTWSHV